MALIPRMDAGQCNSVLEMAQVRTGRSFSELALHLAEHPDALISGNPACPPSVLRLAHVLHDAGHAQVVDPPCGATAAASSVACLVMVRTGGCAETVPSASTSASARAADERMRESQPAELTANLPSLLPGRSRGCQKPVLAAVGYGCRSPDSRTEVHYAKAVGHRHRINVRSAALRLRRSR